MAQQGNRSLAPYPKIFNLLKIDTNPEAKDCLDALALLSLKEHPSLVVVVTGPPHHIRVLWEI